MRGRGVESAEGTLFYICLKKGGELIINYQLEYYEKNLISYLFVYN